MTSPIVVFFWGWKPDFIIRYGDWNLSTWSVVVSLLLTWLGHYALRFVDRLPSLTYSSSYWTVTEQDKLGISVMAKKGHLKFFFLLIF
jgi:hypothetical protein